MHMISSSSAYSNPAGRRLQSSTCLQSLTYLHGNDERQRKITSNLDVLTRQELAKRRPKC